MPFGEWWFWLIIGIFAVQITAIIAGTREGRRSSKKELQALRQELDRLQKRLDDVLVSQRVLELQRLLSLEEREKIRRQALPEGTVTILFSDIEGFASYTDRYGDEAAYELAQRCRQVVREQIKPFGGTEIKSYGDGFMIAFSSARKAVLCAVEIQKALAGHDRKTDDEIRVRIGINSGEPIKEGEDFIGQTVNLAARIAAEAKGGQIYVSEVVKNLAGTMKELQYIDRGDHSLKGFSERQRIYEVTGIRALRSAEAAALDERLEDLEKEVKGGEY